MVNTKVWHAKESVFKVLLASSITMGTANPLDTIATSGSAITGIVKDWRITLPMPDVDKIDLAGTDANGYQNAELEEKPAKLAEISGTFIFPGDEVGDNFFHDAGDAVTGGYTRYAAGKASIRKLCFLINLDDGTDEANFLLNNVVGSSREIRLTGADGHWEVTYTGKCLPRDAYGPEFKD